MTAYYNEFDPKAAGWLRELIADGLIAPGEVDERDIRDVTPDELRPFRQVHLFAGIGGWSAALRLAGWPDERPVWTASCPCQPFSAAGGRSGFTDERHLWPAVYHLATQCRPAVILGEQVASNDGLYWIDLVSSDMEAAGYAGGALDLCSAGFGAPNIRQRLYFVWMADAEGGRWAGRAVCAGPGLQAGRAAEIGEPGGLAHSDGGNASTEGLQRGGQHGQRPKDSGTGGVADAECQQRFGRRAGRQPSARDAGEDGRLDDATGARQLATRIGEQGEQQGNRSVGRSVSRLGCEAGRPGPVNGFWRAADWIYCTDGIWRPVAPGTFPLATGIPGRVALLRGAGNAINVEVAASFIDAVMAVMAAQSERAAA